MPLRDTITLTTVRRLAATLDQNPEAYEHGSTLPIGWHSLFGGDLRRTDELSADGLAPPADVLPEIPLPRRMFGGARIAFHAPLLVGDEIDVATEVVEVKDRSGASGPMTIVVLRQTFSARDTVCVVEDQDVVYLPAAPAGAQPPAGKPAPADAAFAIVVDPSPVMLFRYSALAFNSHRVHYDAPFATGVEGLPGLLVQGRLLAVLAMGLLSQNGLAERTRRFSFRSVRPIYAGRPFRVAAAHAEAGEPMSLWAADADGSLALTATAEFA